MRNLSDIVGIEIGSAVNEINSKCFSECTNLTSITIPTSISSIGNNAFSNTEMLKCVLFKSEDTNAIKELVGDNSGIEDGLIQTQSGVPVILTSNPNTMIYYVDGHSEEKNIIGEIKYSDLGKNRKLE